MDGSQDGDGLVGKRDDMLRQVAWFGGQDFAIFEVKLVLKSRVSIYRSQQFADLLRLCNGGETLGTDRGQLSHQGNSNVLLGPARADCGALDAIANRPNPELVEVVGIERCLQAFI